MCGSKRNRSMKTEDTRDRAHSRSRLRSSQRRSTTRVGSMTEDTKMKKTRTSDTMHRTRLGLEMLTLTTQLHSLERQFGIFKRVATGAYDEIFGGKPTELLSTMPKRSRNSAYKSRKRARAGARGITKASVKRTIMNSKELKFHDDQQAVSFIKVSGGTLVITSPLALILQNATSMGRVGMKIFMKSLSIRGTIKMSEQAAQGTAQLVRVMIVQDKQSNGNTPSLLEILELEGPPAPANALHAFRKVENRNRFNILYDKAMTFEPKGGVDTVEQLALRKTIHFNKTWKNGLTLQYASGTTSGTNATVLDNNIWVLAYAEVDDLLQIEWDSRLRYTD